MKKGLKLDSAMGERGEARWKLLKNRNASSRRERAKKKEKKKRKKERKKGRKKEREWRVVWRIETETRQLLPRLPTVGAGVQLVECGHCCRMWVSLGVLPVEATREERE